MPLLRKLVNFNKVYWWWIMATERDSAGQLIMLGTEEHLENGNSESKQTRRGNPLMRNLTPTMWREPYTIDGVEPINSEELCLEKGNKMLLEAMGLVEEEDWMDYCRRVFQWRKSANDRKLNAEAELLAAQLRQNPELLKRALAKIDLDSIEDVSSETQPVTAKTSKS
jgi:hypothetical protein